MNKKLFFTIKNIPGGKSDILASPDISRLKNIKVKLWILSRYGKD